MPRSLRSSVFVASILWTAGLLALMHMASILVMHVFPGVLRIRAWPAIALGFGLMGAGVFGVRRGLKPISSVRSKLLELRAGRSQRLEGKFPTEIQPLIDDLNALLEAREKAVQRALATAGDLAHGLKTPLALLAHEAERARALGNVDQAHNISQQVERMSRQVDHQLARARAAAYAGSGAGFCAVAPAVEAMVRTMRKLFQGPGFEIITEIDPALAVRVQRQDLDEILGNLLENGCKWGRARIHVQASRTGSFVEIRVEDDGPGLQPHHREAALKRGVRLDETAPGSGLGLAIVRDLAEVYSGSVALESSALGGLRAVVRLPASK